MTRILIPAVAAALLLPLVACEKQQTHTGSGAATPPPAQPEAPITKENLDSELDKLDAEINAQ